MPDADLAVALRDRRAELGLGRTEAAYQMGASAGSLAQWEQGVAMPRAARYGDVRRWLDVDGPTFARLIIRTLCVFGDVDPDEVDSWPGW